jgi:calcium/calmodulin-dependent protein kinase I
LHAWGSELGRICPLIARQQALQHPWLVGDTATDHNLLPEIKRFMTRARLRRGIELVKLANRIEQLKMHDDDPEKTDMPDDPMLAADNAGHSPSQRAKSPGNGTSAGGSSSAGGEGKRKLSKAIKGAIFREVVLAKVREMKQTEETLKVTEEVEREARRRSFQQTQ